MGIVIMKLQEPTKNLVYDYVNDKMFLVEADKDDKLSFSTYYKAKSKYVFLLSLCYPIFLSIKKFDIPIIVYYLLSFFLGIFVKRLYLEPYKKRFRSKQWNPISYKQASLLMRTDTTIGFVVLILIVIFTAGILYYNYSYDYEMKFICVVTIIILGSVTVAMSKDLIICHKLSRKLKKLRTN